MKGDPVGAERVVEWLQSDALGLRGNSVLSIGDLSPEQLNGILICAEAFQRARRDGRRLVDWKGRKSLALLFEKASLRTRVTFELGMSELGGVPIVLGPSEVGLGKRESVGDVARNLDRWVSAVSARVYDHATLLEMHHCSSIPIINALSDREHPCQALADLQTLLQHKGRLEGLRIGWVGDGNNVLHSLMLGAAMMGASITAACPPAYEPNPAVVSMARERAASGATVEIVNDPAEAVADADAVYTDVWISMGEEEEADVRRSVFEPYQVNEELMRLARKDAVFMHCLPAHRGEEVTDAVLDGSHSVVLDQAENRLHAQKALLALTIGP
jgi:ornithine carbamoyltransferase